MTPTVLLVDDEDPIRASIQRVLRRENLRFVEAANGLEALDVLDRERIDLIVLDLRMPVMDGFEFLQRVRERVAGPPPPVCVMTAEGAANARERAVDLGADDFIRKPAETIELKTRIQSLLRISAYQRQLADVNAMLEARVHERTRSLEQAIVELEAAQQETHEAYREMVLRLSLAAETKDRYTAGHLERMSAYSVLLARRSGWSDARADWLADAAKMHDIGKLGIPDAILNKPGKLTDEEFDVMHGHAEIGARILGGSKSVLLQMAAEVARSHHERFDGSGYPRGLSGAAIPEVGRIVAIADVFDALMSRRSYKEAWSLDATIAELRAASGTHFDPHLLALFLDDMDAVCAIHARYSGGAIEAGLAQAG